MKSGKKNNALAGIKEEQQSLEIHRRIKRRVFAVEFKTEMVRHRKGGNLSTADCARKFDVLPKLI